MSRLYPMTNATKCALSVASAAMIGCSALFAKCIALAADAYIHVEACSEEYLSLFLGMPASESWCFHICGHLAARLETQSFYVGLDSAGTAAED